MHTFHFFVFLSMPCFLVVVLTYKEVQAMAQASQLLINFCRNDNILRINLMSFIGWGYITIENVLFKIYNSI